MKDFLWVEKYRPKTVNETILPEKIKRQFQKFVESGDIPNLLLSGGPGCGKTTIAKAMLEELGCSYLVINSSLDNGIDHLRTRIQDFASTMSVNGKRKYVILDEADYLTINTQSALRNFIETFSKNCGFILTCNYKNKIDKALQSRTSLVTFDINDKDKDAMLFAFYKRIAEILKVEGVTFDKIAVGKLINKHFPDFRRVIMELQTYASSGKIDSGVLSNSLDKNLDALVTAIRTKNFKQVKEWTAKNSDIDQSQLFTNLYQNSYNIITPNSVPHIVLTLADYMYKGAFAANPEINMLACLTEIMINPDIEFKQ